MAGSPAKPPPLGLRRTSVDAFLRTVGTELRSAAEFLERPGPRLAPASALPQAALTLAPPSQLPVCGELEPRPAAGAAAGTASTSSAAAEGIIACSSGDRGDEAEVAGLLGMLLPAAHQLQDEPRHAAAAAPAAQHEEQRPGPPSAILPAMALQAQCQQQLDGRQRQQSSEQRDSHAKVLTWLSISSSEPADTIPAAPAGRRSLPAAPAAPAAWPGAAGAAASSPGRAVASTAFKPAHAFPAQQPKLSARAALPAARAAAQPTVQQPVQRQQQHKPTEPANYCAQLAQQATWQPHKLSLVRPPCAGCGRAEADCCCAAAVAAPLRLLRPRQPGYGSPSRSLHRRQTGDACCGSPGSKAAPQPTSQQRQALADLPAAPAPGQGAQGPGGISIASIGTAYFGGSHAAAAPPAAPQATPALPCRVDCGNGGSTALCFRSASAAQGCCSSEHDGRAASSGGSSLPRGSASGGGPLGPLRAIARRIGGMQGDITSFLLASHGGSASKGGIPVASAAAGQHNIVYKAHGQPCPAAAAAAAVKQALPAAACAQPAAPSDGRSQHRQAAGPADPFTDDAILTILTGTDFCRVQQAAASAAAGQAAAPDRPSSQAVQRLKEAREQAAAAVVAVRVGRQARAGQRAK
ncbi:hypothetical protein ABPG75_003850 [Micractinium tetrahymenae]